MNFEAQKFRCDREWPAQSSAIEQPLPRDKSDTMDYESGKKLEFKDHNDREVQGAHDEKVIEAFQKFDTDGSGNISRDELAEAERFRGDGKGDVMWTLIAAIGRSHVRADPLVPEKILQVFCHLLITQPAVDTAQ